MLNDPFKDCIADAGVDVQVTRFLESAVVKGRVVEAPLQNTFCIRASIQPVNARELMLLPEGMRNAGAMAVYTTCELFTVQTSECKTPDRLTYRGVEYQIHSVEDWFHLGGYYRCIAVRTDR